MKQSIDDTRASFAYTDYVGDDITIKIKYPSTGELFNLLGTKATLQLSKRRGTKDNFDLVLTELDGITLGTTEDESHNIIINISKEDTTELGEGTFYGSFILEDSLGKVDTKFKCIIKLVDR